MKFNQHDKVFAIKDEDMILQGRIDAIDETGYLICTPNDYLFNIDEQNIFLTFEEAIEEFKNRYL